MTNRLQDYLSTKVPYLTDGGLETALIFLEGVDLPWFASFTELETPEGIARLARYFTDFAASAGEQGTGFVLDTVTWRANTGWGPEMGKSDHEIAQANRDAARFAKDLRGRLETPRMPIIANGVVGPAGDGYAPETQLTPEAAEAIHITQARVFADEGMDLITAVTMTHTGEAIGVVRAAQKAGIPVAISFTVETDGHLPSGQSIGDAIAEVDAATGGAPVYYMINCAHPDHFEDALRKGETWMDRIKGIRANASRMSHEELDNAEELDAGNPGELASDYQRLQALLPDLKVLGGCCGTDHRHVAAIGHACIHKHQHA